MCEAQSAIKDEFLSREAQYEVVCIDPRRLLRVSSQFYARE